MPPEERDKYPNLILLCKTHHKQVDDQPAQYTVERLREIKAKHEREVAATRTEADELKQQDDVTYSGYVDEWQRHSHLDGWQDVSSWLSADTPTLPKYWYDSQRAFLVWFIGRIWPHRYDVLEKALLNYKVVLQDFLNVFRKHVDNENEDERFIRTKKFYKIDEWDEERYGRLSREYDAHECLVSDLFFELTRAGNFVCDKVREFLYSGYRMKEGALLIERYPVGYNLERVRVRVEYRGDERTEMPYPGLKQFMTVRYTTRDYALNPNEPEPPGSDDEETA